MLLVTVQCITASSDAQGDSGPTCDGKRHHSLETHVYSQESSLHAAVVEAASGSSIGWYFGLSALSKQYVSHQ